MAGVKFWQWRGLTRLELEAQMTRKIRPRRRNSALHMRRAERDSRNDGRSRTVCNVLYQPLHVAGIITLPKVFVTRNDRGERMAVLSAAGVRLDGNVWDALRPSQRNPVRLILTR